MKWTRAHAFSVLPAALFLTLMGAWPGSPARAQDAGSDNEAIAAFKKAALVVEGHGDTPVKADGFFVRVEIYAEGKGRGAVAAACQRYVSLARKAVNDSATAFHDTREPLFQVMRRTGPSSYQGVMGPMTYSTIAAAPENPLTPDDIFKVTSEFAFGTDSAAKVRAAFAAMRASGAQGLVTVGYSGDEKAGRTLALKAALADARQRVQILGDAAKPKVLDLVYIKEGEYQMDSGSDRAELQGNDPLAVRNAISATASVTLFYGFKLNTPARDAKAPPAKVTKATTAGK